MKQTTKVTRVRGMTRRMCRRGAVAAQVAVSMTFLLGMAALVIDMGMVFNTRAELQRTADAAAIGAATKLGDWGQGSALDAARTVAQDFANSNQVLRDGVQLGSSDVVFGRASLPAVGAKYVFTPTETFPNAVRVHVRRTADSGSGAVPMILANLFGLSEVDLGASAAAILTPRDICFVIDLSSSHNDDSQLRTYKATDINNREVWEYLKDWPTALAPQTDSMGFHSQVNVTSNGDGTSRVSISLTSDSSEATKALSHLTIGLPQGTWETAAATAASGGNYNVEYGVDPTTGVGGIKFDGTTLGEDGVSETDTFEFTISDDKLGTVSLATKAGPDADTSVAFNLAPGPTFGNMDTWGTATTGPGWDFANDAGLVRLKKGSDWSLSSDNISKTMQNKGYGTYNADEMSVINSSSGDSSTSNYRRRVRVALGLDRWKSGKQGGQEGGNGDDVIDAGELETLVPYPGDATNPASTCKEVGGSWDNFIDYVRSSSSTMCKYSPSSDYYGDSGLQYRFGLKTYVDYLLEKQEGTSASPGLDGAPVQPMGAVADAVQGCLDIVDELEGDDMVSSAAYGNVGYGPDNKPSHLSYLTYDTGLVRSQVSQLQAGMWTANTCIAGGIDKGIDVLLESPNARTNAAKVMILLTDGIANRTLGGSGSTSEAKNEAKDLAQQARDSSPPIQIFTISVGVNADQELMQDIATIGGGDHYHAEGTIEQYKSQLEEIFQRLGGRRPVILIE